MSPLPDLSSLPKKACVFLAHDICGIVKASAHIRDASRLQRNENVQAGDFHDFRRLGSGGVGLERALRRHSGRRPCADARPIAGKDFRDGARSVCRTIIPMSHRNRCSCRSPRCAKLNRPRAEWRRSSTAPCGICCGPLAAPGPAGTRQSRNLAQPDHAAG